MVRQIFVQLAKIKSKENNFRSYRVAVYGRPETDFTRDSARTERHL